jgi:hypothetical protein
MFPSLDDTRRRLRARYPDPDERVEYLRGATDLQVAKASGLLAYAAIVSALAVFLWDKLGTHCGTAWFCLASGALALVSAGLTLRAIWSTAPTEAQFDSAESESDWLTALLQARARLSNLAVALSGAASNALVLAVAVRVMPPAPAGWAPPAWLVAPCSGR